MKSIDGLDGLRSAMEAEGNPVYTYDREKEQKKIKSGGEITLTLTTKKGLGEARLIVFLAGMSLGILISAVYARMGVGFGG